MILPESTKGPYGLLKQSFHFTNGETEVQKRKGAASGLTETQEQDVDRKPGVVSSRKPGFIYPDHPTLPGKGAGS